MQVIRLDENKVRVVRGKLYNELNIDWSMQYLEDLKRLINFALRFKDDLPSLKKAKYKNLKIYEGGNHLDIIDDGVGSLELLIIEDHFVK